MADFNFQPVASQIKPAPQMSLGDMMNVARGAQQYQQAEQINPLELQSKQQQVEQASQMNPLLLQQGQETVSQAQLKTKTDQMKLLDTQMRQIASSAVSTINNPLVIAAEKNPNSVDPNILVELVKKNGARVAKDLGLPEDKAQQFLQPYIEMAQTNPGGLRQYLKERHMAGLDDAARTAAFSDTGVQVSTGAGTGIISTGQFGQTPAGMIIPGTETVTQPAPTTMRVATEGDGSGLPPGTQYMIGPRRVPFVPPETQPKPLVTGLTPAQSAGNQNFNEYQKTLTSRVAASNQFMTRSEELKQLLTEFKPGAGSETLQGIAQKLQAVGAPQDLVDKVAGGDLSAAQSFNKFLAQSVIAGVRQASGGDQARVAEVENYIKNNPSINTDPRALQRFISFTEKQASRDILEQKFLNEAIKNGTFRPETWIGDLQQRFEETGVLPKTTFPTATPSGKSVTRTIIGTGTYKNRAIVKYSDGSVEYK